MSRHRADDETRARWQEGSRDALVDAGLDPAWVRDLCLRSLREDLGDGWSDVTSEATVAAEATAGASLLARADGVVAGLVLLPALLAEAAAHLDAQVPVVSEAVAEGSAVGAGTTLARLEGPTRVLLAAERTALNLLSRISGVATHTRAWVEAVEGTEVQVLDTRKTTPMLRPLEKYAVRCGGGVNKRMGLYDVAMVKDNHKIAAGGLTAAIGAVRARFPDLAVQVEVDTAEEAEEAVAAGARFLMCDNMAPDVLADAVRRARAATGDTLEVEATGGLTLERAAEFARTGVDYLSVGGLTHSSPALDIALDLALEASTPPAG